ncbi:cupin domain-containing protein [Ichthyenterobacterium magnum]|jgi:mannose-6-phosphate isomerase-like protein (cupin superfamily)|uniref:Mannose-6-phosphate isomerase-like protein (Cupin superfamily) n=1 Tax=Ichthyenterobacterium magnum TaxID=1230530 RepID=A0A420DC44_9FLAO|nr:cupin domain-containing protein [Ichthyenterobacterium magnum]RKE89422.1 mannose-6-phosphate isomerase-like protein (cupin superfamily) [Ichthyenterobacterium magnum]
MEFNFKSEMEINKVNVQSKLNTFNEYWTPKIVGELNNQFVKIAKFKGEFVMHKHEQEDELFYVINGKLFIELIDKTLELNSGEFVIIPKGIEHKPYAHEEVSVMLFEPASTLNTGNTENELTVSDLDKI